MRILFVASEAVPLAKTGGLADVVGTLPPLLKSLGHDVRILLPFYRSVQEEGLVLESCAQNLAVGDSGELPAAAVFLTRGKGEVPCYLLKRDDFYDRSQLYGTSGGDYYDNDVRFLYLCQSAFALCRELGFYPDVLHCHDWQAALVPAYLRHNFAGAPEFRHTRSVLTIHNLAYQGVFPAASFSRTGLPDSFFSLEGMEFWGKANFLKAGIVTADVVTTVSPSYSREILTREFGCGLEGVLRTRERDLLGILNGADYAEWNPTADPHLASTYDPDRMGGKGVCKRELLKEMGLGSGGEGAPLLGMISRLAFQKGIDLVLAVVGEIRELGARCVILGDGEERYMAECRQIQRSFPDSFAVRFAFDTPLAHRILAGCDFLLMPSRYEPCGLNQIHAMRYGTVPIVRATGGLRDTVTPFDSRTGEGTGFVFGPYEAQALSGAIREAVAVSAAGGKGWRRLRHNCMKQDFSWERSAGAYVEVYERIRRARPGSP